MLKTMFFYTFSLICFLIAFNQNVFAQWTTQTLTIEPGWNAVYFEVHPVPDDPAELFSGIPVESIWAWNKHYTPTQIVVVETVETLMAEQREWLNFFPNGSGKEHLTNLFSITGGQAYLIKLGGNQSVTLPLTGKPAARRLDWMSDAFNLVGFHIDPDTPVTFENFFVGAAAHQDKPVYTLDSAGKWQKVNSAVDTIEAGTAYWVYCQGSSEFNGPLSMLVEQGESLDYGRTLNEQNVVLFNHSSNTKQVTITSMASLAPPAPEYPPVAGNVPLSYWKMPQPGTEEFPVFVDLPSTHSISIGPNSEYILRLAVRRSDITVPGLYQSLLHVKDGEGTKIVLAVTAESMTGAGTGAGAIAGTEEEDLAHPRQGLWIGTATVSEVNFPAHPNPAEKSVPRTTESDFLIRLIVHVDNTGQARLLQKATVMWRDGVKNDLTGEQESPGEFIVINDDSLLPCPFFKGAKVVGGKQVGRRVSSAAYGFSGPILLNGQFPIPGDNLVDLVSEPIVLSYNDPLNPFKHKYHPIHNNLGFDGTKLPEGMESYRIDRTITLSFTQNDSELLQTLPGNGTIPGWGDSMVGGVFKENLVFYNRLQQPGMNLFVEGTFRLHRTISAGKLDPVCQ